MKRCLFASIAFFGLASVCFAQHVVQLPEVHQASVNTTVSVPDRGSVLLGGSSSASAGRVSAGLGLRPFGNSAIGGTSGGGGMFVGAQIHDMQAMDEAVLSQSNVQPLDKLGIAGRRPLVLAPEILNQSGGSVADLKAKSDAEVAARQAQAVDELAHARQLLAEGKPGVAKIYFQMAAKHASGDVKQQALAELQTLNQAKAAVTVSSQTTLR